MSRHTALSDADAVRFVYNVACPRLIAGRYFIVLGNQENRRLSSSCSSVKKAWASAREVVERENDNGNR